jgi:hypothetical protein
MSRCWNPQRQRREVMKKGALSALMFFLLLGMSVAQAAYKPELVNNLIVYGDQEAPPSCEAGRVFLLRNTPGCATGADTTSIEVCERYIDNPPVKCMDYPIPGVRPSYYVGNVMGVYWPAEEDNKTLETRPEDQAMDGLPPCSDMFEPCVDHVKFVQGTNPFKHKSFSYFVYDMTDKRGCQVNSATLSFKASPYYSRAAQEGDFTAYIGVFNMKHSCENLTNDEKRACFDSLANNPVEFAFPVNDDDFPCDPDYLPYCEKLKKFSVDVTQSVRADLNDSGVSGYVGFMIGSRDFGVNDIDAEPGMRTIGMTEFVLDVELGSCGGPTVVPATSHWGILVFMLCMVGLTIWTMRKRRTAS